MTYETVEVPFHTDPEGRRYLTRQQIHDVPGLADFVERWAYCFTEDPFGDRLWFTTAPWSVQAEDHKP